MRRPSTKEDIAEARCFLDLLFPSLPEFGRAELRAFSPDEPPIQRFYSDLDRMAGDAVMLSVTRDVYCGVAYRGDGAHGGKSNLTASTVLWADLDVGPGKPYGTTDEVFRTLHRFTPSHSFAVKSSSCPTANQRDRSGVHAYWALERPWSLETPEDRKALEEHLKRLAIVLRGDRAATDSSRVLRIPGTLNRKTDPATVVKLVEVRHAPVHA